jgi:hypothetical protein
MFHIGTLRPKVGLTKCLRVWLRIHKIDLGFHNNLILKVKRDYLGEVGAIPTLTRNREKFISSRIT